MNQHERNDIALAEWPKIKNDPVLGNLEALAPEERVEYIDQLLEAKGRLEYERGVELMRDYALAVLETVHLDKGLNDWKATKTLAVAKKAIETLPIITFSNP